MKRKKTKPGSRVETFNAQAFLDTAGVARKVVDYRRHEGIYSQGDAAETVMYIQNGGVKFTVVNGSGKEAVVAMFGPGDFFWRGMHGGSASPDGHDFGHYADYLLAIQKKELLRVLHSEHELSDHFISYYARAQHPGRRGSDRSTLQLQ